MSKMMIMITAAVAMLMMVSIATPLWLGLEWGLRTSSIKVKFKWFKLAYIWHHTWNTLEGAGLRRRGQTWGCRLSNLVEVVSDVIENKFLTSHHCLVARLLCLLLRHSLVIMLMNFCLWAVVSMVDVGRHPSTLRIGTIVMIVDMMYVRRDSCLLRLGHWLLYSRFCFTKHGIAWAVVVRCLQTFLIRSLIAFTFR